MQLTGRAMPARVQAGGATHDANVATERGCTRQGKQVPTRNSQYTMVATSSRAAPCPNPLPAQWVCAGQHMFASRSPTSTAMGSSSSYFSYTVISCSAEGERASPQLTPPAGRHSTPAGGGNLHKCKHVAAAAGGHANYQLEEFYSMKVSPWANHMSPFHAASDQSSSLPLQVQATHVQQWAVGQQLLQLLPNMSEAQAAVVQMQAGQAGCSSQPCRQRCLAQQGAKAG